MKSSRTEKLQHGSNGLQTFRAPEHATRDSRRAAQADGASCRDEYGSCAGLRMIRKA
ncbi:MAG TPA: hypothetical protein VGB76_07885 [Pyrinomonadaceae bacterium]